MRRNAISVRREASVARLLVWVFNLEGTVDLIVAITLGTVYDAAPYMGAAYWIPTFWVPSLLVTHYITFLMLVKYWKGAPRSGAMTAAVAGTASGR